MYFHLSLSILTLSVVLYTIDTYLTSFYVFSPSTLQSISQSAIAAHGGPTGNTSALLEQIVRDLRVTYGDAVAVPGPDDWFWNNAGGAMGSMVILHASFTEYLIFFGTALQTEGHSGVHLADDYFTILAGEQWAARAGDLEATVYGPGTQNHLRRGEAIQYAMPGKCFALELAQGWIPSMLAFGFADTFSSTLDFGNLWKTVKMTGLGMGRQALRGKF